MEQVVFFSCSHFFGKNPKLTCFEMELPCPKSAETESISKRTILLGFWVVLGVFWGPNATNGAG